MVYELLDEFLGITQSAALDSLLQAGNIAGCFDEAQIKEFIPDARPFLLLRKAVIFRDRTTEQNICALSVAHIDESDCAGHINEELMSPLIKFCQSLALTGRFLSAYLTSTKEKVIVPEVVGCNNVASLVSYKVLYATKPPLRVVSFARFLGMKSFSLEVSIYDGDGDDAAVASFEVKEVGTSAMFTQCWIAETKRLVPAGKIGEMFYMPMPKSLLLRGLRRKKAA